MKISGISVFEPTTPNDCAQMNHSTQGMKLFDPPYQKTKPLHHLYPLSSSTFCALS